MKYRKNNAILKKFETINWAYELYRGSVFQDFWIVLTAETKRA